MTWYRPWNSDYNNELRDPLGKIDIFYQKNPPTPMELWSRLVKKIKYFMSQNSNKNKKPFKYFNNKWYGTTIFLLIIFWIISGFYTIKETERGVVIRCGKLTNITFPGLNWKITGIDKVRLVNVESVRELPASGFMLTRDENVVRVEMNVQYKVADAAKYLFNVTNPDDSLRQATDSALRYVIGHTTMDEVLTRGRAKVRQDTWQLIDNIINPYDMGLQVIDVNFQPARPPEEVKASFDDAIAAQEDEQRFIREAEAYAREHEPKARGEAKRIEEEALAYKESILLQAQGEVDRFTQLLPHYIKYPRIFKQRLYIETMECILNKTPKIWLDYTQDKNILVLPLDQILARKTLKSNSDEDKNGQAGEQTTDITVVANDTIPIERNDADHSKTSRRGRLSR